MSRGKKVGCAFGIIVLTVVGLAAYSKTRASAEGVEVRTAAVARRDLVNTVTVSGKIEPKTAVDVSADITGRITTLAVHEGDMVRKGQFLLQIDPAQYQAAIEREEGQIASSDASLLQTRASRDQAERAWQRAKQLAALGKELIAPEQVEQAETAFQVAQANYLASEAQLRQARASLQEARENLAKTRLVAPIDGRVVRLAVAEGEVAVPGTYSRETGLLMTIADLSVVLAKVRVDETDVVRLKANDSVAVTIDAFPKKVFAGRVTSIGQGAKTENGGGVGAAGQGAVNFDVEITLTTPPDGIRPDLSCTARIVIDQRKQALSIPIVALTIRDAVLGGGARSNDAGAIPIVKSSDSATGAASGTEGVFVVRNGAVSFRPVTVGITGDEYFEVVKGLSERDSVVAGPYQTIRDLQDGARVRPTDVPVEIIKK